MNYAVPQILTQEQKKQRSSTMYVPLAASQRVPHPVRFIEQTSDAEAHKRSVQLELEPADIVHNTNLWASAHAAEDGPAKVEAIEIGEIETNTMNMQQKSDLLHNVALDAQSDLKEQIQTQRQTDEERKKEIYKQAENLDL